MQKLCVTDSAHSALKEATRAVHLRLHKHPVTSPLVKPTLTLPQYIRALQAFERFHAMLESQFHRQLQLQLPDYPDSPSTQSTSSTSSTSCKSMQARNDYLRLGITENPLPPCQAIELDNSLDSLLGVQYVLQGASQGGVIIARNIEKTLGLECQQGVSFFSRLKQQTAHHVWQLFTDYLNKHCNSTDQCCLAAKATFEALETYLWLVEDSIALPS